MKIDKSLSAKMNIIKQLNEDFESLSLSVRAPESDDVKITEVAAIPDAEPDTGDDTNVQRNTTAKITFTPVGAEQEESITFNYRRLSLAIIKQKNGDTLEAKEHNEELNPVEDYSATVKENLSTHVALPDTELADAEFEQTNAGLMAGTATVKSKSKDDSQLVVGEAEFTVKTRDADVGQVVYKESVDGEGKSAFFRVSEDTVTKGTSYPDSSSIPDLDITDLFFPVESTSVPAQAFKDQPLTTTQVHLPATVTSIGEEAFANALTTFEQINLDKVTSVGANAFTGATGSIDLGDKKISIGENGLGSADTITFSGDLENLYHYANQDAGATGAKYKYVYKTTQEAGEADTDRNTYTKVTWGEQNSVAYIASESLNSAMIPSGMGTTVTKIELAKDFTAATQQFLAGATLDELDLTNVTSATSDAFAEIHVTTLILGESAEFAAGAFTGATIANVKVPSETAKQHYVDSGVFTAINPNWIVPETDDEEEVPATVSSTGFTYE